MKARLALLFGLISTAGLAIHSAKAEPALGGAFNITFYSEPNLATGNTWCYQFTTSGGILGYPVSGTVDVPSYSSGWSGQWYQVGDEIVIATVADADFTFEYIGRLVNATRIEGRFTDFSGGAISTAGTFIGVKIGGSCSTSDAAGKSGDPAK